jgi:hypothetical protein
MRGRVYCPDFPRRGKISGRDSGDSSQERGRSEAGKEEKAKRGNYETLERLEKRTNGKRVNSRGSRRGNYESNE